MYKRVLVAVDLDETADNSKPIAAGVEIAKGSGGEVRLLYVRYLMDLAVQYIPADVMDRDERDALARLTAMGAATGLPSDRVTVATVIGTIGEGVLAAADTFNADLIVIGPHRPSMAKFLLGSNATKIVRHAKASVLVAR